MELSRLLDCLLYKFRDERELIKAIEELSVKFTKERERIEDYLKDERLASAYAAFYLTTNIPKLDAAFRWMPDEWLSQLKECELIDLGSGPGTFCFAWREWLGKAGKISQIETSSVMKKQSLKIWENFYPGEPLVQGHKWGKDPTPKSFLIFGHAANEIGVEGSLKYIDEIGSDHILFIEPGTKDFFPKILKIREGLLKRGYQILFPCPSSARCPLENSSQDWCHQFIQVVHSPEIERLSQMAHKDRRLLPLTVHAFSKTFKSKTAQTRLVRVLPETKFSYEWEVCHHNELEHYQVMKRNFDKKTQKSIEKVLAGAAVEAEVEKEIEGNKRVKIIKLNHQFL